ncbi:hypothetical protein BGX21_007559 [Mortierella sp. AD011]|nr:hypothetical protein BGX20_002647 [Mortierella sp. AD010]KAF9367312.1 hypothetical protein BGX21_007559 [Mortierella sp. AD011]
MTSRFCPYLVPRPRRRSSLPPPPPAQAPQYMDIDVPATVEYMEIDGLERPRILSCRRTQSQRAQPAHPRTTKQMMVMGPRSLADGCPLRKGGSGTRVCRTRVLTGGWAALGQTVSRKTWPQAMDVDEDD